MIDESFRLYLIEVNTNPCLELCCPLLSRIIPELLDNCFRLVNIPHNFYLEYVWTRCSQVLT